MTVGVLKKGPCRPACGRSCWHAAPPNARWQRLRQEITVFLNGLKRAECTVKAFDGGTPDEACGFSTAPLSLFLAGGCKAGGWAV